MGGASCLDHPPHIGFKRRNLVVADLLLGFGSSFFKRNVRRGVTFDNVRRLFVDGNERFQSPDIIGQAVRRFFAADGSVNEIREKVASRKENVDAALGQRHALFAQQIAQVFELVRQILDVGKPEHSRAALNRVQRAEERIYKFAVGMLRADEILELQQIGVDLLQQFFRFIAEVRYKLRLIEEIVTHGDCRLFYAEDGE